MVFFRTSSDGFESSADYLIGSYGSAGGSACCILGSGRSVRGRLKELSSQLRGNQISPFSINWGGFDADSGWDCYPALWTSYDYVDRFSANLFRDPSVLKFVPQGREHEWLSDGRYSASECPNVYSFRHSVKQLGNFFGSGPIIDGKDSFVQAIDIAIRLGFKRIFLAGCDLFISLNTAQVEWLNSELSALPDDKGQVEEFILGDPRVSLWGAVSLIAKRKKTTATPVISELAGLGDLEAYSFGNAGADWYKAVMMDHHCYVSADLLVQSRRLLDKLGVSVILLDDYTSPIGRLRRFFPSLNLTTLPRELKPDYSLPTRGVAVHVAPYAGTSSAANNRQGDSNGTK